MSDLSDLQAALSGWQNQVPVQLTYKTNATALSDNATTLNTLQVSDIANSQASAVTAHDTNTSNPHLTTAGQVGGYTASQENAAYANAGLALGSSFPMSWAGTFVDANETSIPITLDVTKTIVQISAGIPVFILGQLFTTSAMQIPMTGNASGSYWLVFSNFGGNFSMTLTGTQPTENETNMIVGKLTWSGTVASNAQFRNVIRLGKYRVSAISGGMSASVSQGNGAPGSLLWT